MSDHEMHTGSDPSDLRHNDARPVENGEHVSSPFDQPEPQFDVRSDPAKEGVSRWAEGGPSRTPRNPVHEAGAGFVAREAFGEAAGPLPLRVPDQWRPDPQGLTWHFGNGFAPLVGLASTRWANLVDLPNVELRTIHAHLMEAVAQARNEMRERGMVVDF